MWIKATMKGEDGLLYDQLLNLDKIERFSIETDDNGKEEVRAIFSQGFDAKDESQFLCIPLATTKEDIVARVKAAGLYVAPPKPTPNGTPIV